ncbi:Centromere-associated protein E [Araneus ventricosus]|uniref:Centromere-associated protein E n=1 Tax=Araneus ventricosus TaxID=182803 RepID=A0A4Y2FDQ1_ARAVE|nr:Centromere-associated protein E [Araneus ventricosus]
MDSHVKVAVRMRPLILSEKEEKSAVHWKMKAPASIYPVAYPSHVFEYTHVFTEKDDNEIIYSKFCSPIIQSVVKGFNGAIIAYGQISSGKTFTMMGDDDLKIDGIIHFSIYDLFKLFENEFDSLYFMRIACFEVHGGKMRDLLSDSNEYLPTTEKIGRVKWPLLTRYTVQKPQDIFNYIKEAQNKRETKCTLKNKNSSGSSLIIDLLIESASPACAEVQNVAKLSHLCFVDLAGNSEDFQPHETGSISETSQIVRMQLRQVIQHLENNKGKSQFIIDQDAPRLKIYDHVLAGNFVTSIICTVSPTNLHETFGYLQIASLAKCLKNKPALTKTNSNDAQLAAEHWNHHQCRNLEIKLARFQKFWNIHFLCVYKTKHLHSKKMSGCSNELRCRKSLPQQPFIYRFCSLATYEPKKRV